MTAKERNRFQSSYALRKVKMLIEAGAYEVTGEAQDTAYFDFGWDKDDICDAIVKLRPEDFFKTDPALYTRGIMMDYYKPKELKGEKIFIKFHIEEDRLIITSFKRNEDEMH